MARRRYTAENGRVVATLGRKDYSVADADRLFDSMERLRDEDLAAGDFVAADSMTRLMRDLNAAIRDARQQERAAA